nr:hypothetical protein [Microbacterium paraoxydans]
MRANPAADVPSCGLQSGSVRVELLMFLDTHREVDDRFRADPGNGRRADVLDDPALRPRRPDGCSELLESLRP